MLYSPKYLGVNKQNLFLFLLLLYTVPFNNEYENKNVTAKYQVIYFRAAEKCVEILKSSRNLKAKIEIIPSKRQNFR